MTAAIADAVACVCNYAMLKVGYHGRLRYSVATVGEYWPGRLWLTRVSHLFATDRAGLVHGDVARLHDHIYLGVVGEDLRDGQRWPVDLYSVRRAAPELHARYLYTVAERLRESLGVVWGIPPRPDVVPELVEPALAQYVPDYPRVVCQAGPPHPGAVDRAGPGLPAAVRPGRELTPPRPPVAAAPLTVRAPRVVMADSYTQAVS